MSIHLKTSEFAKFCAAAAALRHVKDGMRVGLGSGSTAYIFTRLLGERLRRERVDIRAVPTSSITADLAKSEGIALFALEELGALDLVVDGADEISPGFDLIKGGGGALLQEKIVAGAGACRLVIADDGKYVKRLGRFPLPVEVTKFAAPVTQAKIEELLAESAVGGVKTTLREHAGQAFVSDEGNYIYDCECKDIRDPALLSLRLNQIPGVVENGLFIGLADKIVLARADGTVCELDAVEDEKPDRLAELGIEAHAQGNSQAGEAYPLAESQFARIEHDFEIEFE